MSPLPPLSPAHIASSEHMLSSSRRRLVKCCKIMNNEALIAAQKGNLKKLEELLDDDIDVNAQDDEGRTLLHHATSKGHPKIVQCLLQNHADILITTNKNNTALHIAAMKSDESLVKVILETVTRNKLRRLLDAKTKTTGTTALHVAAKCDSRAGALIMLEYGANFEIANDAGEKTIDVASGEKVKELLQMIGTSFEKAKGGDETLVQDIEKLNPKDFISLVNCRNGEGRSLIQILFWDERYQMANEVLWLRIELPIELEYEPVKDTSRKKEVEKLAEAGREYMDFWEETKEALEKIVKEIAKDTDAANVKTVREDAVKKGALAIEKAHEVLLKYRRFEGKERSLTTEPRMKTLEEVIEMLGFDPERLFMIVGEESSYYEKVPAKWKDNLASFIKFIACSIDPPIDYFLSYVYATQQFEAVCTDEADKVQQLIDKLVIHDDARRDGRTDLYIALERGNEAMVRKLLDAKVGVNIDDALSPIHLAVKKGNAQMLQLLLEKVYYQDLPKYIDEHENDNTCLHEAAKLGRLDMVKILLRFGATYQVFDTDNRKPIDVSTSEDVTEFLKLVNDCFLLAKTRNAELIPKLEAMSKDDFLAVATTRSLKGKTLGEMADQCNAKEMAAIIWKMIDKTKFKVL